MREEDGLPVALHADVEPQGAVLRVGDERGALGSSSAERTGSAAFASASSGK